MTPTTAVSLFLASPVLLTIIVCLADLPAELRKRGQR